MVQRGLILFLFILSAIFPALAHPVAQGSLAIHQSDDTLVLRFRVSMEQVVVAESMGSSAVPSPADRWRTHGNYISSKLGVESNGAPLAGKLTENGAGKVDGGFWIYEFQYSLPSSFATQPIDELTIRQTVLNEFEYAPGNPWEATYVVSVANNDGQLIQEGRLLTSKEPLRISLVQLTPSRWESGKEFLKHGIHHILTGYDHLLFVAALVLATATLWELLLVVTSFTLAHAVTLTLATFGVVRLPPEVVEPFIAGSIVFVALQNALFPRWRRGRLRLATAFFFGLFHGLGFAGELVDAMAEMQTVTLWVALIAFSVGVEVGHQVVVLPLFFGLKTIKALASGPSTDRYVRRYASYTVAVLGVWFFYGTIVGR